MNIDDIKNILKDKDFNKIDLKYNAHFKNNKIITDLLLNKYKIFINAREIFYLLKHKNELDQIHIFCQCGNKCKFLDYKLGYQKHCCASCATKDKNVQYKKRQTSLNSIDENGNNSYDRMIMHSKETKERDHNDPNYNNRPLCKKTKFQRYNDENYNNYEQAQKTILQKHGVEHYFQSEEFKNKWRIKQEQILRNRIKTILKKYGVEYYFQSEEFKKYYQSILHKIIKKIKKTKFEKHCNENWNNLEQNELTCLKKYGETSYFKTQEFKNLWKDEDFVKRKQQKEYNTRKKNGTFNTSKSEIKCYKKLLTKFPNALHSYRDKNRYPFNCDMYIPELDLFIECHFGWKHGGEPFDHNNLEHIKRLIKWKLKAEEINFKGKKKKSYLNAIYQWTKLDVRKLKTFQDNQLNYKIFYTEKEFNDWLDLISI